MNVYKLEVLIIDFDELGEDGVRQEIEDTKYSNHCISPRVKSIQTRKVEWSDDHPLNKHATAEAEYQRLFPSVQ